MRRIVVIFLLPVLVSTLARAQYASLNWDVKTTIEMTAALGIEKAQEEMTQTQWGKILDHYGAAELASAGIFASKYLDHLALKDELCFGSEENWYYKHIRMMVAQRIMPKVFNVASMMIKHPDKAIYWGPYLYKTTEEVKQLCMIFQAVCSNGKLSFKDLHFLVIVDDLKEIFDLSRFGGVDWRGMWDNISNIKGLTWDDLEEDFTNLMSVGGAIASAGGMLLDDLWVQASKSGNVFKMSPKEILQLGREYQNTFESLNSAAKIKDQLMNIIQTTDSLGVTRLFKFDEYNISNYVTDYLHKLTGSYFKQRWYIEWKDSGQELVEQWDAPRNVDDMYEGRNGWYFVETHDANYRPDKSVINAAKAASEAACGWSQARCDQLNAEQNWYHYTITYEMVSEYFYIPFLGQKLILGWSFAYNIRVYRSWNGGDTVFEETLDTYNTTEAAFAQYMQGKLMEIEAEDMAANNSDKPLHHYKICKDSKIYYQASDEKRMRGCTAVEFWLNCDNGTKLAEGATEWKINDHIYDDEGPKPDAYKSEAMATTLTNTGSGLSDCQDKINECNENIIRLTNEINVLNLRQKELLELISSAVNYADATQYREEYNSNKATIEARKRDKQKWEDARQAAQNAYSQAYGDYAGESDGCYRIPAIMRECEVNYGVSWDDDGEWEGMTWVRHGKIQSMGVNVTFRGTVSNVRPEEWVNCVFFTLRIHRSIVRISWALEANYSTSDQVDIMQFSNEMSESERSRLVNERQKEIMAEHPDCSVELRYQYSDNEQVEEDNGTYHLLWMSDRLRIAREVDMRLVRIHSELVLLERYLRHSESLLDYLVAPFADAYRQGLRGAMANDSYRRWRQSGIDALHVEHDDSKRHNRQNTPSAPGNEAAEQSRGIRITTENSPSDEN